MTIAIHISAGKNESIQDSFSFKCFSRIAAEQPSHHFIFIFDAHPDPELYLDPNCTPVIVSPEMKNSLLRHYWYNYKLPKLLSRYNADVFVTADNTASMRTTVPQCMIIDGAFSRKKINPYLKKFLPVFLDKAKAVFVTNPLVRETLIKKFKVNKEAAFLYHPPDYEPAPNEWKQNEQAKEQHTEGRDFFFYEAGTDESQLLLLLKAFSLFKKWQKSAMQLVILLHQSLSLGFSKDLSTYKYREEIIFVTGKEQEAALLPAAYAVILTGNDNDINTGLRAMKCGVPVIGMENNAAKNIFGEGILYTVPEIQNLSEKMMLVYKDEHLRNEYIQKGLNIGAQYSWQNTTATLWSAVNAIANQ